MLQPQETHRSLTPGRTLHRNRLERDKERKKAVGFLHPVSVVFFIPRPVYVFYPGGIVCTYILSKEYLGVRIKYPRKFYPGGIKSPRKFYPSGIKSPRRFYPGGIRMILSGAAG